VLRNLGPAETILFSCRFSRARRDHKESHSVVPRARTKTFAKLIPSSRACVKMCRKLPSSIIFAKLPGSLGSHACVEICRKASGRFAFARIDDLRESDPRKTSMNKIEYGWKSSVVF
jgi:hypothetical protein